MELPRGYYDSGYYGGGGYYNGGGYYDGGYYDGGYYGGAECLGRKHRLHSFGYIVYTLPWGGKLG